MPVCQQCLAQTLVAEGNVFRAANLVDDAVGGDQHHGAFGQLHGAIGPLHMVRRVDVADAGALAIEGLYFCAVGQQGQQGHLGAGAGELAGSIFEPEEAGIHAVV